MPRIVPSQVVQFIATISLPEHNKLVRMNSVDWAALSSTLELVDQIPGELLTMTGASYASFTQAKEQIKNMLDNWRANQAAGHDRDPFIFTLSQNPLAVIRDTLAECPDESPAPSTSEFNFVSDSDLRTNLRNDMGAINRALSNGEWKAATVLAGSVIEALLLWALLQRSSSDIARAAGALVQCGDLKAKPGADLEQWNLNEYTEVAAKLGIIRAETAAQVRLAREFRNLIHPGRAQRLGQTCDRGMALSAVAGAEHVARDLAT
ncbi:MAG TPA: hypothetical protein VEG64_12670 [Candidatus Sulfotelmatobacter sp.]|nr:hypothetical protein [Candidatus Sulfotelmatobacter sp.]